VRSRPLRSILLCLAVAALPVLSACGQRTQPNEYNADYEKNFMFGCNEQKNVPEDDPEDTTAGPQAPEDYCKCVYDGLKKKVNFEDAKAFEEQQAEEDAGQIEVPKNIQSVFDSCEPDGGAG
jgi:hypothetical protein